MIPKTVHLTYKTRDVPAHWAPSIKKWQDLGWKVMFHTDATNLRLVETEYPHHLTKYLAFRHPIERVDFVRLCFLHKWGGVYCDLDLVPAYDFYDEIKDCELALLCSPVDHKTFTNMFMVGRAGHPFWTEYMDGCSVQSPIWAVGKHLHIMWSTGPQKMDRIVRRGNYSFTRLGRDWITCTICDLDEDDASALCGDGKLLVVRGQSWNGPDSRVYKFFFCNKQQIAIACGIVIALYIIYKQTKKSPLRVEDQ
jgi:mannosyltransferase OCH1-like enzyme